VRKWEVKFDPENSPFPWLIIDALSGGIAYCAKEKSGAMKWANEGGVDRWAKNNAPITPEAQFEVDRQTVLPGAAYWRKPMPDNLFSAWVVKSANDTLYGPFTSAAEAAAAIGGMQENFPAPLVAQPIRIPPGGLAPTGALRAASSKLTNQDE